jgi:tyrosyl-DNA phosphodiesterase-1
MTDPSTKEEPSRKRRKLSTGEHSGASTYRKKLIMDSLVRPVSPPPLRGKGAAIVSEAKEDAEVLHIKSPFQLTWIRDLPESCNLDAVSLTDILGDPLVSECWNFNYLHDLDFLLDAFDADIRDMVRVHIVHGFWRNEDISRIRLKVC